MGKEKDKKPLFGGIFQKFFKPSAKAEAKKKKEHHLTVQRSIPYLEMGRDGICRVEEHLYSKTVRFYDINYQLAQNEDKNTIFESWCDFLNYFDSSIRFQLSFINHKSDMSEYNKVIQIEPQHDQFDDVRMEYAQMLKQQLAKGNNGLVRTKYITFSIEAKSVKEAKPRLERIETDILNNFKVLGVKAYPLNGVERLQIMYEMLIVQDQVWNRVTINRNAKKNTRYYIDEFHLLLKEEQTAAYSVEIWKRFRKWGGIPTGITQNIKDLLASREIENIFENSDFIYMLNQASGDRQILAKQLNISPFQLSYVTNSNEGEGLLFYGNTIIPFKDKFDTSLKLYGLMTTKPNEIAKYREKKDA